MYHADGMGPTGIGFTLSLLLCALLSTGCGTKTANESRSQGAHTGTPRSTADTAYIQVAGRSITIPPPAGMIDVMAALNINAPDGRSGDHFTRIFFPRERLEEVARNRGPHDLSVTVSSFDENSSDDARNATRFEAVRSSWMAQGRSMRDPDARRIATALESLRNGGSVEFENPLAGRSGDTVAVAVESSGPHQVQLLVVGHHPPSEGGDYDLHSSALVLVRGRILEFMWTRRGTFSLPALSQVSSDLRRWTDAVVEANP